MAEDSNPPSPMPASEPQPPPTSKPSSASSKKPRQRKQSDQKPPTPDPPSQPSPPVLHPYPPYYMNHPYPINGAPYQQHPPPYPTQSPTPGMHPPPPPHAYPYPIPASPHPYYTYQYPPPQPVVMYGAPPPHQPPQDPAAPSPAPQSASGAKRKRKSSKDKGSDDEAPAGSDAKAGGSDVKKRTKTQRACDSCRTRKIRCDVIPDSDPAVCQHCKQYNFDCTFFLPITETRFKKKKMEEEAEKERLDSTKSSHPEARRDVGVLGLTSTTHLLHSQATISSRHYQGYDARYNHSFEVTTDGQGLIQVQKPANEDKSHALHKPPDYRIEREVVEQLVNAYFTEVAPLLPVITQQEFLSHSTPPPILLYSMCLVAAARREVPQQVFDSIRYLVNSIMKTDDVLSTASIVNVQALLILCMTGDCHSQFVPTALSALWIRLGTAIRMAQDLGLHRCESVNQINVEMRRRLWGACLICDRWTSLTYGHPYMIDIQDCDARLPSSGDPNDLYMDELVRLSIILGRVLKAIYTQVDFFLILGRRTDAISSPAGLTVATDDMLNQIVADLETWRVNLPENLQFRGPETPKAGGLLYLLYVCVSMMFWRVFMRISYSCPAHLKFGLTVEQWSNLVTHTGQAIDWLDANESVYDVWLLVAYAAASCGFVQYHTFVRRKDAGAEAKLRKLRDSVRRWEKSISPDHMSARRKAGLFSLQDLFERFSSSVVLTISPFPYLVCFPQQTAEIIALLFEATQGPPVPMEAPALNPTGGVTPKQPLGGLDYRKDPSRPGGGVFVASGRAKGNYQDLPAGTIASDDDESEGEAAATTVPASSASVFPTNNHDLKHSNLSNPNLGFLLSSPFAPRLDPSTPPSISTPNTPTLARTLVPTLVNAQLAGQSVAPGSASMVNFTPLGPANLNPAMNAQSVPNNQVINILDTPQAPNTLVEFAMADNGFLEGIPTSMFDWGQWDSFFARFNSQGTVEAAHQVAQALGQQPPR
ncbi:hypothetical protein D9758_014368 [Tetrapyrgos nigripes]|uniref:Zn(2)-C6 fungal-type domain-containing protein n=1 Tax=Tetrapyrgos nigripes TaxID=182062 RepID=A0A8H5FH00_9AGAR|nr:hypothetical protein D9758_014368 [Tetrapyrgos nigripes]